MTVKERMINVEGDYDEIVKWLDEHCSDGVQYVWTHGPWNVGLFSVVNDVHPDTAIHNCSMCSDPDYTTTRFDRTVVYVDGYEFEVEDPENSHKIVF